ncbi:MAG: hypothetical protein J5928_04090 [Firmicutes bacterium]|nr:hypothetical protein [Bacillota bacterium]
MKKSMKAFTIVTLIALLVMGIMMASAVFALDNTAAPELPEAQGTLEAPELPTVDGELAPPMLPNCAPTINM